MFSSREKRRIAEGVRDNLKDDFEVTIWTEGFFDENMSPALDTFLKNLLCFDLSIVILGDDDTRLTGERESERVPRDNVILELGASLARFGTKKTFFLVPKEPRITLPTYFDGLQRQSYESRDDDNFQAATGSACRFIKDRIDSIDEDAFHSDLPAVGIAHSYFKNFIEPLKLNVETQQIPTLGDDQSWDPDIQGYTVTVVIPVHFMDRKEIDSMLTKKYRCENFMLKIKNRRDLSVYGVKRFNSRLPLNILDVPSTLLTCEEVIARIDDFWGGANRKFRDALARREFVAFARQLRGLIRAEHLSETQFHVVLESELEPYLARLAESQGNG